MKLSAYILAGLLLATTASAQSVTVKCMGWMASQGLCTQKQTDSIYDNSIYDSPSRIVPPVEYDKPYIGKLGETVAKTLEDMEFFCTGRRLGCSRSSSDRAFCQVYLAPDEDIRAAGLTTEFVRRHEIAHCNGWIHPHPGAQQLPQADLPHPALGRDFTPSPTVRAGVNALATDSPNWTPNWTKTVRFE